MGLLLVGVGRAEDVEEEGGGGGGGGRERGKAVTGFPGRQCQTTILQLVQ